LPLQFGCIPAYSVGFGRGAEFKIDRVNILYQFLNLVWTDEFFEPAAYSAGQRQFAITESTSTSKAANQIAGETEGTAPFLVLDRANAGIDFPSFIQEQDVESSATQFQAGKYARGAGTNNGDIMDSWHLDSLQGY
jgi:hypothetical protein